MKTCSKCKVEKDESEFHKQNTTKDGLRSRCKICHLAESKEWRLKNPEKQKYKFKSWKLANYERYKELKRVSANKNYHINKDKICNKQKDDRKNNKTRFQLVYQNRKQSNPIYFYEKNRRSYLNNKHKNYNKKYVEELKDFYVLEVMASKKPYLKRILKEYPQIIQIKKLEIITKRKLKLHNNETKN